MLERGLPPADPGGALEASAARWFGISELGMRNVGWTVGWRSTRWALGLSQTGSAEIGWTALGLAAGVAQSRAGVAMRAVARRDRTTAFRFSAPDGAAGVEIGGGAWARAGERMHVWASAPQIWETGAAAPMDRPLELGAALRLGGLDAWIAYVAPSRLPVGAHGEHAGGVAAASGPFRLWIEARDRPLRGSFGLDASAGPLTTGIVVDGHPVLGETVRASVGWRKARP
jgi:hypothetical protein